MHNQQMQDNQWPNWPVAIATKTVETLSSAQSKAVLVPVE